MCRLLETIKIQNGVLQNIEYHNERFNRSRSELFGTKNNLSLQEHIKIPADISKEIFKCRLIYSQHIESVEFIPYQIKQVRTLKLVNDNKIEYSHKYLDRSCFEKHLKDCGADDILIVKNGLLTDASYANIIFFDGFQWFTPALPLLEGTKRKSLLEQGSIIKADLRPSDLKKFKKARLINAMLEPEESYDIEIISILF